MQRIFQSKRTNYQKIFYNGSLSALVFSYFLLGTEIWAYINSWANVIFGLRISAVAAVVATALLHSFYLVNVKKGLMILCSSLTIGFFMEIVGVTTGFPFGGYIYNKSLFLLFNKVFIGVPPMWFTLGYIALNITNELLGGEKKPLIYFLVIDSFCLTSWDLTMDPVMSTGLHTWTWVKGEFFGVPLTNFVGWTFTGLIISFMNRVVILHGKRETKKEKIDVMLYLYLYLLVYFVYLSIYCHHPEFAVPGIFAMVPYLLLPKKKKT